MMNKLRNGWVEGTVQEMLRLSGADMEYIETRRAPAACLRDVRTRKRLTQAELATRRHGRI